MFKAFKFIEVHMIPHEMASHFKCTSKKKNFAQTMLKHLMKWPHILSALQKKTLLKQCSNNAYITLHLHMYTVFFHYIYKSKSHSYYNVPASNYNLVLCLAWKILRECALRKTANHDLRSVCIGLINGCCERKTLDSAYL